MLSKGSLLTTFLGKWEPRKDAHSMVLGTVWQIKASGTGDTGDQEMCGKEMAEFCKSPAVDF